MDEVEERQYGVDIHGKHFNRWVMVALILVGTFGAMLMQTSLGTAVPTLMKDFNISMSTAQQATTWFLLANGIMVPVSAYLATKFPTRWLYVLAYIVLFAGMFLAYSAPTSNWTIFLAGRILQAVAVGITMPLMQVVLVNMFPPKQMGAVMGLGGIVIGLAPAIGPTFAGWLLVNKFHFLAWTFPASWRTIFLIPMVVVGVVAVISIFLMRDVVPNRAMKLDILSFVLSIAGFGLFLWGFTNVATDGWTKFGSVIAPIIGGVILIVLFALRQLKMKDPFLDLRVFKIKQFTITTVVISLSTMAMMGVEMMLPLYLQEVHSLSPLNSGLVLLPGALMMGLISPLAGAAYDRVGAKRLAQIGFVILGIGTIPFMFFTVTTPDHFVTLLYGLRMVGIAMVMMPLTASAMNALPREEVAHGTASNNTARQVASAVVVALLSSVTQNVITNNSPASHMKTTNPLGYASRMIDAMLKGYHTSFAIGFGFAVLGFIIAFMLHSGKVIDANEVDNTEKSESIPESAPVDNTSQYSIDPTISVADSTAYSALTDAQNQKSIAMSAANAASFAAIDGNSTAASIGASIAKSAASAASSDASIVSSAVSVALSQWSSLMSSSTANSIANSIASSEAAANTKSSATSNAIVASSYADDTAKYASQASLSVSIADDKKINETKEGTPLKRKKMEGERNK